MLQLIHFLIAMVKSPSKTLAPKRKFGHLALEGGEDATAKLNNLTQFTQGPAMDVSWLWSKLTFRFLLLLS